MKKGRHKLLMATKKTYQIKARFNKPDFDTVLNKACQAGLKPAVYVARAATCVTIKEPLTKEMLLDIKKLVKIGVNLNQIALKINSNPQYLCQEQLQREINNLSILRQQLLLKLTND